MPLSNPTFFRGTPAVCAPSTTGFTVTVTLNAPALAWLEYGETPELGCVLKSDGNGFVPCDDRVVKLRLQNLRSGTRYFWRVVLQSALPYSQIGKRQEPLTQERTTIYSHRTLSEMAEEVHFSMWNDTHDQIETVQKLHATQRTIDDFLLWNGDVSNNVDDRMLLDYESASNPLQPRNPLSAPNFILTATEGHLI